MSSSSVKTSVEKQAQSTKSAAAKAPVKWERLKKTKAADGPPLPNNDAGSADSKAEKLVAPPDEADVAKPREAEPSEPSETAEEKPSANSDSTANEAQGAPPEWLQDGITYFPFSNVNDNNTGDHKRVRETWETCLAGRMKSKRITHKEAGELIVGADFFPFDPSVIEPSTIGSKDFPQGRPYKSGRNDAHVIDVYVAQFDLDNKDAKTKKCVADPITLPRIKAALEQEGLAGYVYSTGSNTPGWPKLRVVVFLKEPFHIRDALHTRDGDAREALYRRAYAAIATKLFGDAWDKKCANPSRLLYTPAHVDHTPLASLVDGAQLDLEAIAKALPPEAEYKKRGKVEKPTVERARFDAVYRAISDYFLGAEYHEAYGENTAGSCPVEGVCPFDDEHSSGAGQRLRKAFAYNADEAKHGVATFGCLHEHAARPDLCAADFVWELMQAHGLGLEDLRDFIHPDGIAAFDSALARLEPDDEELDELFDGLANLVDHRRSREAKSSELSATQEDIKRLEKEKAAAAKSETMLSRKSQDADRKVQAADDKLTSPGEALAALEAQIKACGKKKDKTKLKARLTLKVPALTLTTDVAARALEREKETAAVARADLQAATARSGELATKLEEASGRRAELEKALADLADNTSDIREAEANHIKRLAAMPEGVDFNARVERLSTLTSKLATALFRMIKGERDKLAASRGRGRTQGPVNEHGFILGANGRPHTTSTRNARQALQQLGVVVRENLFSNKVYVEGIHGNADEQPLGDVTLSQLLVLCEKRFDFLPSADAMKYTLKVVARENAWHPVVDYLNGLKWDGVPRVDGWLTTYLRADDCDINRAFGRCWLLGAVSRVFEPGCKFDQALVLESEQGTGKSTALRILAKEDAWFTDSAPIDADDKTTIEQTAGKWIAELAELAGYSKSDLDKVKAFLSRQVDTARMAYAVLPDDVPRQFICAGTTNNNRYLKDQTGNRRFWPVKVGKTDEDALRRDVDQLWAEVVARYKRGERGQLDPSLYAAAAAVQRDRTADNPYYDVLVDALGDFDGGRISAVNVYRLAGLPTDRQNNFNREAVSDAMAMLGWQRREVKIDRKKCNAFVKGDWQGGQSRVIDAIEKESGRGYIAVQRTALDVG